jgi:GT2 family glycosyltransferase
MKNQENYFIKEKMSKVCIVTVTYGNRFHILKQVLDRIVDDEYINKIFIIDNASDIESRKKLQEYPKKGKIFIKHLKKNIGSAGGFKKGLELAYKCNECEYIFLLDDDNLPEKKLFQKYFKN